MVSARHRAMLVSSVHSPGFKRKPRAGQFDDLGLGDLRIEGPVEVRERLHDRDPGLFEAAREQPVGTAGELVLHEQFEKLQMRERSGFGLRDAPGEGVDHAG